MRKRTSRSTAVLTICLLFLGPLASGLLAAETRTTTRTIDPTLILKAPSQFLFNLFPFLRDLLANNDQTESQMTSDETVITATPVGTIKSVRLNGGD